MSLTWLARLRNYRLCGVADIGLPKKPKGEVRETGADSSLSRRGQ
jgi:hypothetical protein